MAVLRLLGEEGIGADVSTLGELRFARRAGLDGRPDRRAREQQVGRGARRSRGSGVAYVVLDSVEELERAREVGIERMLVRVTPGIEADTHESIRTGHVGSKFGVTPEEALELAPHVDGLHVHVGSQLLGTASARETIAWLNGFLEQAGWTPDVVDLGGGLGVPTLPGETAPRSTGTSALCSARSP